MLLVVLLEACATPEGSPPAAWEDTSSVGWWYEPSEDATEAVWTPEEALSRWAEVIDGGLPQCGDVTDDWLRIYAAGATCLGDDPGAFADDFGCVTDDGWWFRGVVAYRYREDPATDSFEHVINLDVDVYDPQGAYASFAGSCGYTGSLGSLGSVDVTHDGSWSDEGASGYLGEGVSGMWGASVVSIAGPWQSVGLRGGLGVGDTHLVFDEFEASTLGCAEGRAGLLDPAGYWYEIDFDEHVATEDGGCDMCGGLSFGGRPLGLACVDWRPLVAQQAYRAWHTEPWEGP